MLSTVIFKPDTFPPVLQPGCRVWTKYGYTEHGPMGGPKQDIPGSQGGEIITIEKPYYTMDHFLYSVRWDSGQISKHYSSEFLPIGHFRTLTEFLNAFKLVGKVELQVGPSGGFRFVKFKAIYDGKTIEAELWNRDHWKNIIEPAISRDGIKIIKIKQ